MPSEYFNKTQNILIYDLDPKVTEWDTGNLDQYLTTVQVSKESIQGYIVEKTLTKPSNADMKSL